MEVDRYKECDDSNDSSEDELLEMASILLIMKRKRKRKFSEQKNKSRRAHRFWVRQIFQTREEYGELPSSRSGIA